MKVYETSLTDAKLIETDVFGDHRGFFTESYSKEKFINAGITYDFIQDNHSLSIEPGVLRGLHFQLPPKAQTKLIRATTGVIYDVIVDIRKDSPTYKKWEGFILSEHNHRQLLVPKGFAHGFVTLTPNCNVQYKVDEEYSKEHDSGIAYNDETFGIDWPISLGNAILSEKDKQLVLFSEFENPFVLEENNR